MSSNSNHTSRRGTNDNAMSPQQNGAANGLPSSYPVATMSNVSVTDTSEPFLNGNGSSQHLASNSSKRHTGPARRLSSKRTSRRESPNGGVAPEYRTWSAGQPPSVPTTPRQKRPTHMIESSNQGTIGVYRTTREEDVPASLRSLRALKNQLPGPVMQRTVENELVVNYLAMSNTLTLMLHDRERGEMKVVPPEVAHYVSKGDVETDIHTASLDELLKRFGSNLESGLSESEAKAHIAEHGKNELTPPSSDSYLVMFLRQLLAGFAWVLWAASILSFIAWRPLGDPNPQVLNLALAVLLLIVIFISAIFNFYQEYSAGKILAGFASMAPPLAEVLRGGVWQQIPAVDVTVGDIVRVSLGVKCPADLRLTATSGLKIDNSMLTGESDPITTSLKATSQNYMETKNLAFYGSNIVEGEGQGLVVAIGDATVMGKISTLTNNAKRMPSSMQREISHFVTIIVIAALITAIVAVIGWAAFLRVDYPGFMPTSGIIINVISMVVAYVPEGLPISVTVTLGLTARKMAQHNVLVKDLTTIETFNTVSLICSDKTGTLTQNKMSVSHVVCGVEDDRVLNVREHQMPDRQTDARYSKLFTCATLCNNAVLDDMADDSDAMSEPSKASVNEHHSVKIAVDSSADAAVAAKQPAVKGDASDTAIFNFTNSATNVMLQRQRATRLGVLPFNSKNKFMLSIHMYDIEQPLPSLTDDDGSQTVVDEDVDSPTSHPKTLFLKGAPEKVLDRCDRIVDSTTNQVRPMTADDRKALQKHQQYLGEQGERVLAFSYTDLNPRQYPDGYIFNIGALSDSDSKADEINFPVNGLIYLGMMSLIDPPKLEVPKALADCKTAHIRVAMVTGDHPTTAAAIARQIGLISYPEVDMLDLRTDDLGRLNVVCLTRASDDAEWIEAGVRVPSKISGSAATDMTLRDSSGMTVMNGATYRVFGDRNDVVRGNNGDENHGDSQPASLQSIEIALREGTAKQDAASNLRPTHSSHVSNAANDTLELQTLSSAHLPYDPHMVMSGPHAARLRRGLVLTGAHVAVLDKALWDWVLRHDELVFARTTPDQKLRIVMEAQARGESVAVTGDGVNDAPALRQANLGIAMQSGSEVAREAGHMILMDNNFGSIVKGIELGRTVYDNLKKVCIYLLPAGSFSEMLTVLANVFIGIQPPLSSFYMIIISICTDVFASTSLIYEKSEGEVMKRPPRNMQTDRLVDGKLVFYAYGVIGIIDTIAAWTIFLWYMNDQGIPPKALLLAYDKWPTDDTTLWYGYNADYLNDRLYVGQSLFFVTLVVCQFGNLLSIRTRRASIIQQNPLWGPKKNLRLFLAMTVAIATMVFVTFLPWFQDTFNTRYADARYATAAIGFAAFILLLDETRKYFVRNRPNSVVARMAW